jgi:hypothetical protein
MTKMFNWIFRRRKPAWTALERSLIAVAIAGAKFAPKPETISSGAAAVAL